MTVRYIEKRQASQLSKFWRLDFSRKGSGVSAMAADPVIDPETSNAAQTGLLAAVTAILEAALDGCSAADAFERMPAIGELCSDAATLASATVIIRHRGSP